MSGTSRHGERSTTGGELEQALQPSRLSLEEPLSPLMLKESNRNQFLHA